MIETQKAAVFIGSIHRPRRGTPRGARQSCRGTRPRNHSSVPIVSGDHPEQAEPTRMKRTPVKPGWLLRLVPRVRPRTLGLPTPEAAVWPICCNALHLI